MSIPIYISDDKLLAFGENTARRLSLTGELPASRVSRELLSRLSALRRAHDAVEKRAAEPFPPGSAEEWLLDNHYLAQREGRLAAMELRAGRRLRSVKEGALLSEAMGALVRCGEGSVTPERVELFLEGFQRVYPLSRAELSLLVSAIRAALVEYLAELFAGKTPPEGAQLAAAFGSLRLFSTFDLSTMLERVDLAEQVFLRDPAGVYPLMDEESRDQYRRRLTRLARRSGTDELRLARSIIESCEEAEGEARHIGRALFRSEKSSHGGAAYIAANLLGSLFFTLLAGFALRSAAAGLLLLLPVSELVKCAADYAVLRLTRPRFIPRLALSDGVPPEGRTVCVVSALLCSEEDGEALASRLEQFSLLSRDCGENLLFGILADLPEAENRTEPADAPSIEAAKRAIEKLNDSYGGGFYLLCRRRSYSEADRRWFGKERKRGALLSLARLMQGQPTELAVVEGDARGLRGARYILTLDADTLLSPRAAKRLIGAMLHPLNAPVIDPALGRVVSGFGLIHPRISVELGSAVKSGFSRIFAGQGGAEPYGFTCGEVYMDLFGHGGFSGKGIIDCAALLAVSPAIPEGRVLSHDAVEGALLRGGYMSDTELLDGFPASPLSFYRRMHRWTRGDWQNARFLLSPLADEDKWRIFDSLRRSLVAPATFLAIFLGLLLPRPGLTVAAFAALLCVASRLVLSCCESALRPVEELRTRYHSGLVYGAGGALIHTALSLMLLPYEAWVCLSAILTALWRMAVSRRNLLSWQTAAQTERGRGSPAAYFAAMAAAPIAALALFLLGHPAGWAVGLVWLLSPFVGWALAQPQEEDAEPKAEERRYLTECAADIWRYFEEFCTEREHFLPPDNWQERPPLGLAHRSSPTNIGLALVSALAALDLGLTSKEAAFRIIEGILHTMERLPKWHGHLLNWYDTRSLRPLPPDYVSTVDSGNLAACLLVLKAGAQELGRPDLSARAGALYDEMDFSPLYDEGRQLFHIGFDLSAGRLSEGLYDLMSSEARLTGYLAIARGDVPAKHWQRLSRALVKKDGYRGMASWTGTMFEYLMPELFLPLCPESLLWESAKFCVYVQKKRVAPPRPWGVSESAFFSLDPSLSYRYKAHGCAALALKRGMDEELVVSPYSSFLALAVEPEAALKNLRRLEKLGLPGRFGFWEAVDFTPSRCRFESGETVRCVMSHHLGMSLAAIANRLCGGVMQNRFMREPAMRAYRGLLEEKIPIGGVVISRRDVDAPQKPPRGEGLSWQARGEGLDRAQPDCCLLSNGVYSLLLTDSGLSASHAGGVEIYAGVQNPLTGPAGLRLSLESGGQRLSLLPCEDGGEGREHLFSSASALLSLRRGGLLARCSAAVSAQDTAEARLVELETEEALSARLVLEFEPALALSADRAGHPAFWRLGLCAQARDGALLIRRLPRGKLPGLWFCLACDLPLEFSANDGGEPLGWLSEPFVRAAAALDIPAGGAASARFALAIGANADEAFAAAQRTLSMGPADFADLPASIAALYGMDSRECLAAAELISPLVFPRVCGEVTEGKEALWRFGISGDLPIICAGTETEEEQALAPELVREQALLSACGLRCDLVFLSSEGGDYLRLRSRAVTDELARLGLEHRLGAHGGVFIVDAAEGGELLSACAALRIGDERRARAPGTLYPPLPARRRGGCPEYRDEPDGSFSFTVKDALPRRAWSTLLANRRFGCVAADSGCGSMWYENAREGRICRWTNESRALSGDESLSLSAEDGVYSLFAAEDGRERLVRFGLGFAEWHTGETRVTAFVPPELSARVLLIENAPGEVLWRCGLVLSGEDRDAPAVTTRIGERMLFAKNARGGLPEVTAAFSATPLGLTCDLASFLRGDFDGACGAGLSPCFGARLPGGDLVIVCGADEPERLMALASPPAAREALRRTREFWQGLCCRLTVETPDEKLNRYLNGRCAYQAIACRLMGRGSLYQSGGAFGFRDQLQDAVNLMLISPLFARERILDCCAHQYRQGDVMHWWHPEPSGDRGVRTRCSDDLLWLPWALCEYVERSGDEGLLAELAPYLCSEPLAEDEHSRYERPPQSVERESVLLHCQRALSLVLERGFGTHGLLLIGDGDWNDGMDEVGAQGRGESVWLSWFFAHTARRFAQLLERLGKKADAASVLSAALRCGRAADRAWDGGWYLRGYYDDGSPLGSAASHGCKIDSIAQSWAAFCAESSAEKRKTALDAAVARLFDREGGLVKLFTPPFGEGSEDAGYIKSYGPGFRENGGQYTHGAVWLAAACFREGRPEQGAALLHALCSHEGERYGAEPFVLAADIYTAPERYGEAGWSWYTGAAGWFFRTAAEDMLGLRLQNGELRVQPCLPKDWPGYRATWREPSGRERKIEVTREGISLDGSIYK